MKAEELEGVLWKLTSAIGMVIRVYRYGLQPNDADIRALEAIWSELDAHRLEMVAAETGSPCKRCGTTLQFYDGETCLKCQEKARQKPEAAEADKAAELPQAKTSGYVWGIGEQKRLIKRLGEIEQKHDDLSRYYETHMKNCHTGTRR